MKRILILAVLVAVTLGLAGGCKTKESLAVSMEVVPTQIRDSIPGQNCVFLLRVAPQEGQDAAGKTAQLSATAEGATVTVAPEELGLGQVAEITAVPDPDTAGQTITVTITGLLEGVPLSQMATLDVQEAPQSAEELGDTAAGVRDAFIPWLAENKPETGITLETEWSGTIVRPNSTGVGYYLFFSDNWEMGLSWNVAPSPNDWARIYLRHRGEEIKPSLAFEIASRSQGPDIQPIDPPQAVWR